VASYDATNSKVVVIVLVGAIFANLDNRSITMKMASIPFHLNSWVMKSMETFSHGLFGISRGLCNPKKKLYGLYALALNTSVHKMLYILLHFRPIEFFSYGHSCGSFALVPCRGLSCSSYMIFMCNFLAST
jgi:hypothetical protein